MFLNIGLFCITMVVIPLVLGMLFISDNGEASQGMLMRCYVQGVFTMWGVFQVIAVLLMFLKKSLTFLTLTMGAVITILCIIAVLKNGKKVVLFVRNKIRGSGKIPWQMVVALILIIFQTYMLTARMQVDDDDAFYVAAATTAVETDTIFEYDPYTGELFNSVPSRYALSPFFVFLATLARASKLHPMIIAHTLFPAFLIPLAYMVYALIGESLFAKKREAVGSFLIFISLLQIFSAYSIYTTGVFTLTRIWQGKAVLAGILLPAVFYFVREVAEKSKKRSWLGLLLLMLACCMVSSMGIFLGAAMLGMLALILSIQKRSAKILLYSFLCCLPNLIYAGIYLVMRY